MQLRVGMLLTLLALGLNPAARADMELVAPDGRKVTLKDDGSWKYVDAKDAKAGDDKAQVKLVQAMLQLEDRTPFGPNCRVELKMTNNLPYEIVQIVPYFSAYRASGVMHQSLGEGFQNVRPADSRTRVVEFTGIDCDDIKRIQVVGGDRCEMGELSKFTPDKGVCLDRVQVAPSTLLTFEK
jgi:hypothetical protein